MVLCTCDWLVDLLHFGKKSQKTQRRKNRQKNILEDDPSAINLSVINVQKPPTVNPGINSITEDSENVELVAAAVPSDAVNPGINSVVEDSGNLDLVAAAVPNDAVVPEEPAVLQEIVASEETAVPGGAVDAIELEDTSTGEIPITGDPARTARPASCSHMRVNSATSWTVGDDATFATL